MRHARVLCTVLALSCTALVVSASSGEPLSDPYEVLARHYAAIGGLERIAGQWPYAFEGKLSVAGLNGTFSYWSARPGVHRSDVDLGIIKQVDGDNGDVAWQLDTNGKLSITKDEVALRQRELELRLERMEHLDPGSDVFDVSLDGMESVGGRDCYVVRIESSLDGGFRLMYIDAENFLELKTSDIRDSEERHTLHYDYADAGGILRSHRDVTTMLPTGQTQTMVIGSFDPAPVFRPSFFDPPEEGPSDFSFTTGKSFVDVPFRFIERHLFVPVTINGDERLWVLDTGASMSVIDADYAGALGIEAVGDMKGVGAGSTVNVSFVALPPFSIPGVEFYEQKVASLPISSLFEQTTDLEIGGILGYDFLSRFVTRVDYANESIRLYLPDSFEYEGGGAVLEAPLSGNVFGVMASVDEKYEGWWTLDLGAGGVSFHYPYARDQGFLDREGVSVFGFGAGGRIDNKLLKFSSIELGGFEVDAPIISCPEREMTGAFGGTDRIGNIGNTLLRHFVLYLDYERQQVIVERGDDFAVDFPVDRSGLQLWRPEGRTIVVLNAAAGTPAADAGLAAGDVVVSIDGVNAGELDLLAIRRMMRGEPGTEYTLGILRDGEPLTARIVLRNIL